MNTPTAPPGDRDRDNQSSDEAIPLDRRFEGRADAVERLTPLVRRVLAPNAGPFTFTGTCSYIVGNGEVAIIDPGPMGDAHIEALLAATRGETVSHVLVTHTHRDHSPAAAAIKARTGAMVVGCAAYVPAPAQDDGRFDTSHDRDYRPDRVLRDGEALVTRDFTLTAVATPGHAANHLAFAFAEENAMFSGDHVMAWSTTVVIPPDGSMGAFMASLERLRGRPEAIYWPGHGGPVNDPQRLVRALIHHRRQREGSILNRLRAGDGHVIAIVERIYEGLNPALKGAAAMSVLAHLEHLVAQGIVACDGTGGLGARYFPVQP